MSRLPPRFLFACLLPVAAISPVHADEADVFNLRATMNVLRDDNLFRVPNGQKPEVETIFTTIAGVDFNKRISRQEIIAHVNWVDTRYQKNDYLNAGTLNYDARWLWAAGSSLTGELAAERGSAQNSFADFQGLRQRNLRTVDNQRFSLEYAFLPSWQAVGRLTHQTVTNDHILPQERDYEATGAALGMKYTPVSGNWFSFVTRQVEGRYTSLSFVPIAQLDDKFTDRGQEFAMSWRPTGHTSVNGRLEYLQRRHPNFASRDFSGWTGQLGYLYQYTAKTTLSATYLRMLNPFQDNTSSYYVLDDLIFGSRWEASAKVTVGARLGYSQRRYQGEIVPLPGPRREDRTTRAGFDVVYKAERWLDLKAGLTAEKRNSSGSSLEYTDQQFLLSATATF